MIRVLTVVVGSSSRIISNVVSRSQFTGKLGSRFVLTLALEKLVNDMDPDLPNNLQAQVPIVSKARYESDKF